MYIVQIHINTNCILHKACVLHVLCSDLTYFHIPGDQGGPLFFRLIFFSTVVLTYKLVSSSLGGAKNYHYQHYFVPYKILYCIISQWNHHVFMVPIESVEESFLTVSW
jgi:hypothetical protein